MPPLALQCEAGLAPVGPGDGAMTPPRLGQHGPEAASSSGDQLVLVGVHSVSTSCSRFSTSSSLTSSGAAAVVVARALSSSSLRRATSSASADRHRTGRARCTLGACRPVAMLGAPVPCSREALAQQDHERPSCRTTCCAMAMIVESPRKSTLKPFTLPCESRGQPLRSATRSQLPTRCATLLKPRSTEGANGAARSGLVFQSFEIDDVESTVMPMDTMEPVMPARSKLKATECAQNRDDRPQHHRGEDETRDHDKAHGSVVQEHVEQHQQTRDAQRQDRHER